MVWVLMIWASLATFVHLSSQYPLKNKRGKRDGNYYRSEIYQQVKSDSSSGTGIDWIRGQDSSNVQNYNSQGSINYNPQALPWPMSGQTNQGTPYQQQPYPQQGYGGYLGNTEWGQNQNQNAAPSPSLPDQQYLEELNRQPKTKDDWEMEEYRRRLGLQNPVGQVEYVPSHIRKPDPANSGIPPHLIISSSADGRVYVDPFQQVGTDFGSNGDPTFQARPEDFYKGKILPNTNIQLYPSNNMADSNSQYYPPSYPASSGDYSDYYYYDYDDGLYSGGEKTFLKSSNILLMLLLIFIC